MKEYWTGQKVRENMPSTPVPVPVPVLPAGYSYHDYDLAGSLCSGYSGWGTPFSVLPQSLSDTYSLGALRHRLNDPHFENIMKALASLSPLLSDLVICALTITITPFSRIIYVS
jgi:hypothetical protein